MVGMNQGGTIDTRDYHSAYSDRGSEDEGADMKAFNLLWELIPHCLLVKVII